MSSWTHITACLSVDTGYIEKHPERTVRKYLKKAPKITGSERNADVFVNLQKGYNFFSSTEGHFQTCVTISVQGDLRDRVEVQTQEEFDKFLEYVKKEYYIRDYAVNIEGE